jgi:hypothetical protein
MKTTKFNSKALILAVLTALTVFIYACGETPGILGPNGSESLFGSETYDNNGGTITLQVVKGTVDGYYFKITNNSRDTIVNDFHVQMVDTTVLITGFSTWPSNWVMDQNTSNKTKGKVGVKTGQYGQPILPGQVGRPLWIDVKLGKSQNRAFNWQATRDGVTVASGLDSLPR